MSNVLKLTAELYIEICLILITLYCLYRLLSQKYKKNVPPGPIGLPFVGYLPFLGDKPHETIAKLSKKYGDVIGMKLGSRYTVFLNEYNVMKEALCHPAAMDKFAEFFQGIKIGFGTSNGSEWQEQRKFCLRTIKNLGLGKGPWGKLTRESVNSFIKELRSFKGQPTEITQLISDTFGINIMSLMIGRKLNPISEKEIIEVATSFPSALTHYGPSVVGSLIPGFRKFCIYFHLLGYDKAAEKISSFYNLSKKEVEEHQSQKFGTDEDFINVYREKMKQMENDGDSHYFSDENLLGNIAVLYLGGTDTVASSVHWLIRLMVKYPEIQEKVQKELDNVIGTDGAITYEERSKVPYTFAVMQEAQRYATIFPLTSTRRACEDFEVGGYTIPKGSVLTANMWAVNHDPRCYEQPFLFNPERFLSKDCPKLIVFSFGKRNCPGETIAWMVIMTFFSALMQKFTISTPPGVALAFGEQGGLSGRLNPQLLCFKERN